MSNYEQELKSQLQQSIIHQEQSLEHYRLMIKFAEGKIKSLKNSLDNLEKMNGN